MFPSGRILADLTKEFVQFSTFMRGPFILAGDDDKQSENTVE